MTRLLSIISLVGIAVFILVILVLHFLPTSVNPMVAGISFYALTRFGVLLSLGIILVSVSGIALGLALWPVTTAVAGRIGLLLLLAWGLTSILAGLFPVDAPGANPTFSGRIHNLAGMNFLLITPAVLCIELSQAAGGKPRKLTFWLAWLLLAAAVFLFVFNGPLYAMQIGGLVQRLYWLVLAVWLICKSWQALHMEKAHSASYGPT